jgi:hypothetical protein
MRTTVLLDLLFPQFARYDNKTPTKHCLNASKDYKKMALNILVAMATRNFEKIVFLHSLFDFLNFLRRNFIFSTHEAK